MDGDACVCYDHFTTDDEGLCTVCETGYTLKDDACVKGSNSGNNGSNGEGNNGGSDSCNTTIIYKNSNYSGKSVYLIGDFNGWNKEDANYKFTESNGAFSLTIDGKKDSAFAQGHSTNFKVYIGGGLSDDEAYRSVPAACTGENGNCSLNVSCGQTMTLDENSGSGGVSGGGDNGGGNGGNNNGECITTFKYYNAYTNTGSGGVQDFKVHLVGEFNEWEKNDSNYTMNSDGNGCHTIQVKFSQGSTYKYKFHVEGWENQETGQDDGWQPDPFNTNYDEMLNSTAYIASCGQTFGGCQGDTPCTTCNGGGNSGGGNSTVAPTDANAQLQGIEVDGLNIKITFKGDVESVSGGVNPQKNGNTVTDTVPKNSKYTYFVKAGGADVYVPVWVESEKFDWHDAILYFAFTDRFMNGNTSNDKQSQGIWENSKAAQWYGGDFAGLKKKVDDGYFDRLGVNTLWISSVTKNTEGVSEGTNGDTHNYTAYHSYWPVSAFRTDYNEGDFNGLPAIEDHFGTIEELRALVDTCHEHGIRVLVDFAANHVFKDSPMVQKHGDWFNDLNNPQLCDNNNNWDNYSEKCWFSQDLPDINYENGDARKTMVDHAIWLIKNTNVDGFRVDAVKHMNIQFIKDLRYAVDQLFTNTGIMFYMVGETFTGDMNLLNKYIGNDLLHAQFDFPLYYKIGNVLRGHGLYDAIYNGQSGYKAGFNSDLMGTFMGNHDVARAISVAAGQNENKWGNNDTPSDWTPYRRMMAAWMILLTQPGVPLIYYGDEYGMPGSNDPDNRRMMQFDGLNEQQNATLGLVQSVANIRRAHKALSRGERTMMGVPLGTSDNSTVCYKMSYNGEEIIVGIGMEASGAQIGSCKLDRSYNLVSLFDSSKTTSGDTLDLSGENFQIWLVQ